SGPAARSAPSLPGARGQALPKGRSPSPAGAVRTAGSDGSERAVCGVVRSGRRTKLLVKRLARGEIALIDHRDLDRVSAEELIAAGVAAVLNCSASSSGSYPNLGPQLLVEAGVLLVDLPDDSLFDEVSDGDPLLVAGAGPGSAAVRGGGERPARGEVLDLERVRADTEARRREIGEALERFARN